jgi:hypothetical protein
MRVYAQFSLYIKFILDWLRFQTSQILTIKLPSFGVLERKEVNRGFSVVPELT